MKTPRTKFGFHQLPSVFLLCFAIGAAAGAPAAEWQRSRPVRMIIPSGAGGITDILGKGKPGYLNHGSVGTTSMGHLGAELFRRMAGIDIAFVIVRSPEFTKLLTSEGATPVANTPAEFDAIIRADVRKWARVIKEAGIGRQ